MKDLIHYTVKRQPCRHIQTGTLRDVYFQDRIQDIQSVVSFKNTGPYELSYGVLGNSIKRMLVNSEFYDVFVFPEYRNANGEPLKVYAPKMFIEHISKIIDCLALDRYYLDYREELRDLHKYLAGSSNSNIDFWWNPDNDFYIFFGDKNEELILLAQKAMKEKNFADAPSYDWDTLSSYYLASNPDLDDEAKQFLKPKRKVEERKLINVLNKRINDIKKND